MMQNKALMTTLQNESWAMEPMALNSLFQHIAGSLECEHISNDNIMVVNGDVATIKITGSLMKTVPALFKMFGIAATSYTDIINNVNSAATNDSVKSIMIEVDSPGGQVNGVEGAADAIYAAGLVKDVTAKVDGVAASAAYWLASQASKIEAGSNAMVGSIGVYSVYVDYSKMAKNQGIDVKVIRSGEHKGMGVEGASITDTQIEAMQKVIDGMATNFITAVARGRGMKKAEIKQLADGRVFIAKDAKEAGLIDKITNSAGANVASANNSDSNIEVTIMSDEKTIDVEAIKSETQAETVKAETKRFTELQKEFPDDLAFVASQYVAGANIEMAKGAYCDVLKAKLLESNERAVSAEKIAEAIKTETVVSEGTAAIDGTRTGDGPQDDFMSVSRELSKTEKISMTDAMKQVAKEQPDLHKAYRSKTN